MTLLPTDSGQLSGPLALPLCLALDRPTAGPGCSRLAWVLTRQPAPSMPCVCDFGTTALQKWGHSGLVLLCLTASLSTMPCGSARAPAQVRILFRAEHCSTFAGTTLSVHWLLQRSLWEAVGSAVL